MFYTARALERGKLKQLIVILMQVDARIHPLSIAPDFMDK